MGFNSGFKGLMLAVIGTVGSATTWSS